MATVSPDILAATQAMSKEDRAHLVSIARPRLMEPYTKHIPHPAQQLFLSLNATEEVMYGGAAGGGKCLTEDHDVLTPDGWVPIATVNTGDLVASWHTDGAMTWERVAATYAYDHDGPLRTSPMFRTTPNHKWRAGHRSTANEVKTWRWYDATELRPQMSVPAVGEPLPTGSGDLSPEEMELLGWWLSEGSGYDKNMARISQTKPEGRARIIKLCEYLGLKHTVYEREIRVRWEAPDRRGTAYDKFIPRWAFQQRNLQNLLDGLLAGDGYMRRDGWEYSSSSKQLAEDVQELATRLGLRATMRQKKVASDNPHWIVSAYPRKTWTLNTTLGWEQFTGKVYCITVPATSTFLVRHNGRIHVTGNSDALLMGALQYVDVPGYSALILRRTWADLSLPGAIMDRAREWLADTDARPRDGGRIWVFPSGARISFGYLQYDKDKYRYQSAEFQFIGFDELTQFEQSTYEYMFSRIRRPALVCLRCSRSVKRYDGRWKHTSSSNKCDYCLPDPKVLRQYGPSKQGGVTLFDVPLRMRSATNPGGSGHQWVRDHFIDENLKKPEAIFVPALLTDNPSLDQDSYKKNLEHLNPVDRERLLNGDWDVSEEGAYFQRHWFRFLKHRPDDPKIRWMRYWDLAATVAGDYTAGALVGLTPDNEFIVADVRRIRATPQTVERFVAATAHEDGHAVPIRMEQEPGASGVALIDYYRRKILLGFDFRPDRKDRSKEIRANPVSSQVEAGNVYLVAAPWNRDFLDEVSIFPLGSFDDMVDAFTGAFTYLAKRKARLLV
jgi:predicted phage terminase large subunit-like protein